jgi:hypothetical protein
MLRLAINSIYQTIALRRLVDRVDFALDLRYANLIRLPAKSLKLFLEIEFSLIYDRRSKTGGLGIFIYFIVYTIAK